MINVCVRHGEQRVRRRGGVREHGEQRVRHGGELVHGERHGLRGGALAHGGDSMRGYGGGVSGTPKRVLYKQQVLHKQLALGLRLQLVLGQLRGHVQQALEQELMREHLHTVRLLMRNQGSKMQKLQGL